MVERSPFTPAIAGTWIAGDIFFVNGGGVRKLPPPDLENANGEVFPVGIKLVFEGGQDGPSGDFISLMKLPLLWPPLACTFPLVKYACVGEASSLAPPAAGYEVEFSLEIRKITSGNNAFEELGARPGDLIYGVVLNGRRGRWDFLATGDGRALYTRVALPRVMWPRSTTGQPVRILFQVFDRHAD